MLPYGSVLLLVWAALFCGSRAQELTNYESSMMISRCVTWYGLIKSSVSEADINSCNETTAALSNFFKLHERKWENAPNKPDWDAFVRKRLITSDKRFLLWSGNSKAKTVLANRFSNYQVLETSNLGFMFDGWWQVCIGSPGPTSPKYCPWSTTVWEILSANFAARSVKEVFAFLNGSRNPILRNGSLFETVEVPVLDPKTVEKLNVMIIDTTGSTERILADPSLKRITNYLTGKNIIVDVQINVPIIVYASCLVEEEAAFCNSKGYLRIISIGNLWCIFYSLGMWWVIKF